ncbi:MAG TPA: hypothetical protein ENJ56_03285 [Anaerolineae bacterium]|nr:hypothetical protein [Anaerolineae bacterium]
MRSLTPQQQLAIQSDGSVFLVGSAGTGKTTVLLERMQQLLQAGETAYSILVLVADPQQREQFITTVQNAGIGSYSDLNVRHFGQLAREMVELFWPLVARDAGFANAYHPPTFLGYDLAQLLMWRIVEPMIASGAFADLRRRPQQIVSQLLDTLNRAALNRMDVIEATERQINTWVGEQSHLRNLRLAQEVAQQFRAHCLANNLLDLSLTTDTFSRQVLAHHEFSRYFSERFRHLMVDNLEEQTPAGQAFVAHLLDVTQSATVVYDEGGGYRRFLAADPVGANRFRLKAQKVFEFGDNFVASAELDHLSRQLGLLLKSQTIGGVEAVSAETLPIHAIIRTRYRREMLVAVAGQLADLIHGQNVPSKQIAIIVPYLDNALRYTLTEALKEQGIAMNIVRRRASPRDEPRVRAWLTWVALAHPDWGIFPTEYDVAEALALSIHGLDPARAALLAQVVFPTGALQLISAEMIPAITQERIGASMIALYEELRLWLLENGGQHTLDHFLYNLFGLLSKRSFQPEPDVAGAGVLEWLVQSAVRLTDSAEALQLPTLADVGVAFLTSINKGLVTSQPPEMGDPPDPNGVLISTIYGYLLRGQPVKYQVWLETAASGWWDIPRQPLSNAFVLAASYDPDRMWTMAEEIDIRNQLLARIIRGLTARCGEKIILATSDLDRRGQRQDGTLWRAFTALGAVT